MLHRHTVLIFSISSLLFGAPDSDHVTIREPQTDKDKHVEFTQLQYVDAPRAAIHSASDVGSLLGLVVQKDKVLLPDVVHNGDSSAAKAPADLDTAATNFYCIVHIMRWKDPDKKASLSQTVDKQNWYVYNAGKSWRKEDFADRNRLFGSKNVWLLFIHLNARDTLPYEIRYEFDLTDLTPAPLQHGLDLITLIPGVDQKTEKTEDLGSPKNYWGMYRINVKHVPNEMGATAEAIAQPDKGESPKAMGSAVKFVNEGLYNFDFGVAVPIKKISQVQVDSTNGVLTPKKADTTNAFGVIDIYPYKVDVRNTNFSLIPYVIGGVKIGSQPLHNILAGVGWGPKFAQFYIGAMFVKQEKTGTAAQPTVRQTGYETQFSFGINLSVKGFNDVAKKSK